MIQAAFKKNFSIQLITPPQPIKCILEGAVFFGLNPDMIAVRRARKTYGFETSKKFVDGIHLESDKYTIENEEYGKELDVFVRVNEEVHCKDYTVRKYYPISSTQTSVRFNVYECDNAKAEDCYLSAERSISCKCIGNLELTCQDTINGMNRVFMVKIRFGRTRIEIEATDLSTQNKIDANFDFISSQ